MIKALKYVGVMLTAIIGLTACSPEQFEGPNQAGVPTIDQANVQVTVDQTTNQVTFVMDNKECYPIWMIPSGKNVVYSTVNGLQRIFATAGDYTIEYRIGNRNGISQATGTATFHIDNSIVNYDQYFNLLAGGSEGTGTNKVWRIDNTKAGHMGCGPSGTTGLEWWSAGPNEKAAYGVYDDRLTFTSDGSYTYDPGEGGTTYVNYGCTVFAGYTGYTEDFSMPTAAMTTSYSFSVEGDNLYLVLPANTLFPYIPNDEQYREPKLLIESISSTQMELVYDNGNIAWHYILTCGDEGFDGYNSDSEFNLWKKANVSARFWYATPDWQQREDPDFSMDGVNYTFFFPYATTQQWQAQCFLETDIVTTSDKNYDFSAHFKSNVDLKGVTVKLFQTGDDGLAYFVKNIDLKAYDEYVFYVADMPGIDMSAVSLVLDFGGCPDNTEVSVTKVDLQEHAADGIIAPEEEDQTVYDYNSEMNLWRTLVDATGNYTTSFYYAPGWAQISDPGFSMTDGVYTIDLPVATFDTWQAQVHIISTIPGEADVDYDFSCKLTSNTNIGNVTVKLTDVNSDGNYFFAEGVKLNAYEELQVKFPKRKLTEGAASALKLVLDFGGNPDDTQVTVREIVLQKTAQ